jgi:hypothetical protein
MKDEKKINHLNIFFVKESFTNTNQIIKTDSCNAPIEVRISGHLSGQLFIKITPEKPPKWAALFHQFLDPETIKIPGVSAIFLLELIS